MFANAAVCVCVCVSVSVCGCMREVEYVYACICDQVCEYALLASCLSVYSGFVVCVFVLVCVHLHKHACCIIDSYLAPIYVVLLQRVGIFWNPTMYSNAVLVGTVLQDVINISFKLCLQWWGTASRYDISTRV